MNIITLDEAIKHAPSIGSKRASDKVSDKYQFVSSRQILEVVHNYGWRIVNVKAQGKRPFSQHRVTLVQQADAQHTENEEGIPRIEMFNSHDRTKRLMFAVGFFRFVCSNGLMVASGPTDCLRMKHRFSGDKLQEIMEHMFKISERFPNITKQIETFKQRELNEAEQLEYAKFALLGKFRYRQNTPKRYANIEKSAEMLLAPRREQDRGNSTWLVYNRIQENIIKGVEGTFRPIRGYADEIKINQLLWKGAETTLTRDNEKLAQEFKQLLVKDGKKGKISC